jgi:uncharacterized membrane protein YcaP (DUF421 family)
MDTVVASSLLSDLFDLDLPVMEKVLRSLLVFLFLVLALRLAGKREVGQLNVLDVVVLLLVSNVLQNAMIGEDNTVTGGFIGAATLFLANYLFVRFTFSYPRARAILEGTPTVLLSDGELDRRNLARQAITEEELLSVIRERGFDDFSEVGKVQLEPNGHITVLRRSPPASAGP